MFRFSFEQLRQRFVKMFEPRKEYKLRFLGDPSGTIAVSGMTGYVWVRDGAGNLERVKRGDISANAPANLPVLVTNTSGYSSGFDQTAQVFTDQISGWTGANYDGSWVGVGYVAFGDTEGNIKGVSNLAYSESGGTLTMTNNTAGARLVQNLSSDTAASSGFILGGRTRDTSTSPDAVQSGDQLFRVGARGFGATQFPANSTASIKFVATENMTDSAGGTKAVIDTSPNGSLTKVDRVTVDEDGLLMADYGLAMKRTISSGALTVPDGYSIVVLTYLSLTGSASLTLAGDAEVRII